MWPYFHALGGDVRLYGVLTALFSLSRMVAAPALGWWSDRYVGAHRHVLLLACVMLVAGNFMYSLYPTLFLLIVSRLLIGVGAGTLGEARGYISLAVDNQDPPLSHRQAKKQRTSLISWLSSSQFASSAASPGAAALFALGAFSIGSIAVNEYTAPGLFLAALSFLAFVAVIIVFREPVFAESVEHDEAIMAAGAGADTASVQSSVRTGRDADDPIEPLDSRAKQTLIGCVVITVVSRFCVSMLDTIFVVYTLRTYGWSVSMNAIVVSAMGAAGFVLLLVLPKLLDVLHNLMKIDVHASPGRQGVILARAPDILVLLLGLGAMALGFCVLTPNPRTEDDDATEHIDESADIAMWRAIVGAMLVWSVGFALTQTLVNVIVSDVLGRRKQSFLSGALSSIGSLARIGGALWGSFALTMGGWAVAYGTAALISAAACLVCALFFHSYDIAREWYKRLRAQGVAQHRLERSPEQDRLQLLSENRV
jgi:MFS family permease